MSSSPGLSELRASTPQSTAISDAVCLLRARVCESKVPQLAAKALRSVAVDSAAAMGLRAAKAALYFRANEDLEKLGLVSKFTFLIQVRLNEVSTLCSIFLLVSW